MSDKKISQLVPRTSLYADDFFLIARGNDNKRVTLNNLYINDITYSDLADLKNGTNNNGNNQGLKRLIKGQWYFITDKFVYVRALSDHELLKNGFFRKQDASRGSIRLSGTQGSVISISVNNVNILNTPVAFNSDIKTTMNDIKEAINGFTSSPDYKVVAREGTLDIYSLAANGINANGFFVDGVVSNASGDDLLLDNAIAMHDGKEETLPIEYDFDADQISGIEHIGFTGTQPFIDQIGFQTLTSGSQFLFEKDIEVGQQVVLEGLLQGFREDYKEAYTAKFFIQGWRSETEAYIVNCKVEIWKPNMDLGSSLLAAEAASTSNKFPFSRFVFDENDNTTVTFYGAGNAIIGFSTLNGWTLNIGLGENIHISAGSSDWEQYQFDAPPLVDTNYTDNWLFTYTYRILNNNF